MLRDDCFQLSSSTFAQGLDSMGMTASQLKAFVSFRIDALKGVKEETGEGREKKLDKIIEHLQSSFED
ncbi:MAG: hypothetical protein K2N90_07780 [Lachnospiraceae bacterium]|nr:hypothetical protein [Lachnospiraceae bacterium]